LPVVLVVMPGRLPGAIALVEPPVRNKLRRILTTKNRAKIKKRMIPISIAIEPPG